MQQQHQHINANNNNNISTLPCPSILSFSTTSTALKPGNLSHLSASVDTISTTNNSINSTLSSSIYMATRTGARTYQIPQSSSLLTNTKDATSVVATETTLISPSICTMTIPTQNFPPSLAHNQTTITSSPTTSAANNETTHNNIISTYWSEPKNFDITPPFETNINSHHQAHMFNSNKSLLASTTSTSTNTNNHQRSSTTASLLFVRY